MEASSAFAAPIDRRFDAPVLARLGRVLALSALGMLVVAGLVIFTRRAAGALSQPLSPAVLAALGLALAGLAVLFRRTFSGIPIARATAYVLWAAPSVVLLIWAAAVSLEGSDTLGLVALFGVLLLEEGYSWGRLPAKFDVPQQRGKTPIASLDPRPVVVPPADEVGDVAALEADRDEAVTQHVIRRQDGTGEAIEGWLRVEFAAAQRHATAHLAICPPLDRVPECFAEQMDGPPAQIRIAQVLAYGVRFEIRLDQPSEEPASVFVEFSIQARPDDRLAE